VFGRSKFGILGEKGLKPVTFLTVKMTVCLSELQASGHCKLLELGRLSELQTSSHNSFCDLVA